MQKKFTFIFLSIFLISLFYFPFQPVSAASNSTQTFETNPLEYWNLYSINSVFNQNNTVTISKDISYIDWYNTSFQKREIVYINGSSGAGTNYQVNFTVNYDSDMKSDFSDLLFTDNDGLTKLPFWIEEYTASTSAKVWVKVSDNLDSDQYIFMYYDYSSAISESNGDNTFIFFDDFENNNLNRWSNPEAAWSTESSVVAMGNYAAMGNGQSTGRNLYDSGYSIDYNFAINKYIRATSNTQLMIPDYHKTNSETSSIYALCLTGGNSFQYYNSIEGYTDYSNQVDWTNNKWYSTELYFNFDSEQMNLYVNNTDYGYGTFVNGNNSTITDISSLKLLAASSTDDLFIDNYLVRKWTNGVTFDSFGNEQDISDAETTPSYIDIPLSNSDSQAVKTMVELTKLSNESITFQLNTSLGIDTSLSYTVDTSYNLTRVEVNLKHAINVYRITTYDEDRIQIAKNESYFILSKNVEYLRISLNNFTTHSKLTIFYMSGYLDYSTPVSWSENEATSSSYLQYKSMSGVRILTGASTTTTEEVTYTRDFDYFQYLRTYINYDYQNVDGSNRIVTGTWEIILDIENFEIDISIEVNTQPVLGEQFQSYITITDNSETVYTFSSDNAYDASATKFTQSSIKIWRTLENHLGVAFGSDCELFHTSYDTRRDAEFDFSYWYSNRTLSNYDGQIWMAFSESIINDGSDTTETGIDLSGFEYDFSADFAVAEPHFSSFWADLFGWPFGNFFDTVGTMIGGTLNNLNDLMNQAGINPIAEFDDFLTGIGQSVANFLEPAFTRLGEIFSGIGDTLSSYIETWGQDAFTAIVDILGTVASSIATFLVWFINGIGSIMGITDLATTIGDIIANFGDAVIGWIGGFATMIEIFAGGVSWAMSTVADYVPLAIYILTIFFVISILGALVTFDFDVMKDVLGWWVNIAMVFGNVCYQIANAIIQFIGGIIP